jgi:hypothetical protein
MVGRPVPLAGVHSPAGLTDRRMLSTLVRQRRRHRLQIGGHALGGCPGRKHKGPAEVAGTRQPFGG